MKRNLSLASLAVASILATPGPAAAHHGKGACGPALAGPITLPADDAAHPYTPASYEWWYWSVHLEDEGGKRFGFAEIVYTAQMSPDVDVPLQWADHTITDIDRGTYHFDGRMFEQAPAPLVKDGFRFDIGTDHIAGGNGKDSIHSVIDDGAVRYVVDLKLDSQKTPVLQRADGFINYYSRQRMTVSGTVLIDGRKHKVKGSAWFDHQFGDQLIELSTFASWTWIASQLDDGRELLALLVQKQDGGVIAVGDLTDEDCGTVRLGAGDFTITPTATFASPIDGCTYPLGWDVAVPGQRLRVHVEPVFANQEIHVPGLDRYWEGESVVSGDARGRAYVELFGYCPP